MKKHKAIRVLNPTDSKLPCEDLALCVSKDKVHDGVPIAINATSGIYEGGLDEEEDLSETSLFRDIQDSRELVKRKKILDGLGLKDEQLNMAISSSIIKLQYKVDACKARLHPIPCNFGHEDKDKDEEEGDYKEDVSASLTDHEFEPSIEGSATLAKNKELLTKLEVSKGMVTEDLRPLHSANEDVSFADRVSKSRSDSGSIPAAITIEDDGQSTLFDPKANGIGFPQVLTARGPHVTPNEPNGHIDNVTQDLPAGLVHERHSATLVAEKPLDSVINEQPHMGSCPPSSSWLRHGNALDEGKVGVPIVKHQQSGGPLVFDTCLSFISLDNQGANDAAELSLHAAGLGKDNKPFRPACEFKEDACESILAADFLVEANYSAGEAQLVAGPSTKSMFAASCSADPFTTNLYDDDVCMVDHTSHFAQQPLKNEKHGSKVDVSDLQKPKVAAILSIYTAENVRPIQSACESNKASRESNSVADLVESYVGAKVDACRSIIAAGSLFGPKHSDSVSCLVADPTSLSNVAAPCDVDMASFGADHASSGSHHFNETILSKACASKVDRGAHEVLDLEPPICINVEPIKPHVETKWAALFKTSANVDNNHIFKLDHIDLSAFREGRKLVVPEDIAAHGSREWHNTIVGFFLGRRLPFSLVHNAASKFWQCGGLVNTLATDQGTFFFQFDSAASVETVLEGGPWNVAGKPLILQKWTPSLSIEKNKVARVPIWVCFYNVPLEYWNQKGLSYIASMIGKPIQVDRMTAKRGRITYARICIEVDAKDDWITSFDLEAANPPKGSNPITIRVEYQWVPERCNVCICFGHDCNRKPPAPQHVKRPISRPSQEEKQTSTPKIDQSSTPKFEPLPRACNDDQWTKVVKKGKAKVANVEELQVGYTMQQGLSSLPDQGLKMCRLDSGVIPYDQYKSAPQARENVSPSIGTPSYPSTSVSSIVTPLNNRFQVLPSEEDMGAAMDLSKAVQDTSHVVDGVGNGIAHIEADQDIVASVEREGEADEVLGTGKECDEDEESSDEVPSRGSPELGCPSSSRQRKKASKKKSSGSRPKGRHKH